MKEKFSELSFPSAPKIIVKPPGPKARAIIKRDNEYIPPVFTRGLPIVWEQASGATLRDVDGNTYIDFTAGWHVTNAGHCHPKIGRAIKEQVGKLLNCNSDVHTLRYLAAKKLSEVTPKGLKKSVFLSTGSDAAEAGVKIARNYTKKSHIIAGFDSFHGRTLGAASFSGGSRIKDFGPYAPGVLYAPPPYCFRCLFQQKYPDCGLLCLDFIEKEVMKRAPKNDIAGVLIEPFPGSCSMPETYIPALKELCEKNGLLFIAEEVASGMGRTGKMFACEHWGVVPDILCVDKGLGNGVPASAVVAKDELWEQSLWEGGEIVTTYGMNPLSCAAAIATLDVMRDEKIPENAAIVGEHMLNRLKGMMDKHRLIGDVRGKGLRIAIDLVKDKKTKEPLLKNLTSPLEEGRRIFIRMFESGLYTYPYPRWTPPLVLTRSLADKGLDIFDEALGAYENCEL